jgi:hypothetical protein
MAMAFFRRKFNFVEKCGKEWICMKLLRLLPLTWLGTLS